MGLISYLVITLVTVASLMSCIAPTYASSTPLPPSELESQRLQSPHDDDFCPPLLSEEQWNDYSKLYCLSGRTFHAQRTEDKRSCILVCLQVKKCQPGEVPILRRNSMTGPVFIKCQPCENNSFESTAVESYKYRNPVCRDVHQTCGYPKAIHRMGNATHDAACRCLWEKGFAPNFNTSECTSPEGFIGNTVCDCKAASDYCPEGMLNAEYKCVPQPSSTEKQSTKHKADHTKGPEATTRKPTVDTDNTDEPAYYILEGNGWKLYLAAWVTSFLAAAVFLCVKFHP